MFGSAWRNWMARRRGPSRRRDRPAPSLMLEQLETRSLLSNSIPLNPISFTSVGPAPILNGQDPGNQPTSGRITGVAANPTDSNMIYVSTAGGGVWKTMDGGAHWIALTDTQPTLVMGAIAIAPSNPSVLYAGTGEANNSGDSLYGRGILKSIDAGATWTLLGNDVFNRREISRIAVDPSDPSTAYVAVADEGSGGVLNNTGIWKTSDGGQTWINTTSSITTLDSYTDVAINPANPRNLFAAVGNSFGALTNGVYSTQDGGQTWTAAGNFPGGINDGVIRIALAPSNPQVSYAAVTDPFTSNLAQMLKSTDGGQTWTKLAGVPNYLAGVGFYASALAADPQNANIVYAGGGADSTGAGSAIVRSTDGGATWQDISGVAANQGGPHANYHAFGFDKSGRLLAGTDGGIWRLDDPNLATLKWTDLNANLATVQFVGVALDPRNPALAYGGSQANGTDAFTGTPGWNRLHDGDGGFVRVDPSNGQTIYREGSGISLQRSDDGGQTWASKITGIGNDASRFYVPYVLDPARPSRLLLGTDRVYETTDRADHWTALSAPNTNGWSANQPIDSLAAAPTDANTIYAAADGHMFVTTNHGVSWTRTDPSPRIGIVYKDIVVDPTDSQIAYAVAANFADVTGGGHVFMTTNGGASWSNISANLPDLPTRAIALDPRGPGHADDVLYVGTDNGVFVSFRQGLFWSAVPGMPNVVVTNLALNTNLDFLAAGTYGRGMFELLTQGNTIGGTVFQDTNANGSRDPGEPGVAGWTVFNDVNNNGILDPGEPSVVTDSTGAYALLNVGTGLFQVREVVPAGWTQKTANPGVVSFDHGGLAQSGIDFGNFQNGVLTGRIFNDANDNGAEESGEAGLAGVSVFADANGNGKLDAGEVSSVSAGDGSYALSIPQPETIRDLAVIPNGFIQTTTNPNPITITSGTNVGGLDFGAFKLIALSGQVFQDTNGNSIKTPGEPGLSGWTVFLDANNNGMLDSGETSTTTDAAGNFQFRVVPGVYRVREVAPAGWVQTTSNPASLTLVAGSADVSGLDFGNFQRITIGGKDFQDSNGNGQLDAGEPPVSGATVFLDTNGNGKLDGNEPSTTTDAQGAFAFHNLGPGTYEVREVIPNGVVLSSPLPADVHAVSGTDVSTINFGNFQLISISGRVFRDANDNGAEDPGEPGLSGWTVFLDDNHNGTLDPSESSTMSDASGNYVFANCGPGAYRIRLVLPLGWQTTTPLPGDFDATSGVNITRVDLGNFQVVGITGQVFEDHNGNGVKDDGDQGLAGRTVFLDSNGNGALDPDEQNTTTNASGNYVFPDIPAGTFRVREVLSAGVVFTTPLPPPATLQNGMTLTGVDFGNFQTIQIHGHVFQDTNENGLRDPGEPDLAGWTLFLDANDNDTLDPGEATAVTDTQGNYTFTGLGPGTYRIREVVQTGSVQTTASPSDVVAASGEDDTVADIGNFKLVSIGGQVFQDQNGDGIPNGPDSGLAGWTVQLQNASTGMVLDSRVTDSSGNYRFANLNAGTYRVRQVLISGFVQTTADPPDVAGTSGVLIPNANFGNFQTISVRGRVFDDLDANGNDDQGTEPGVNGYAVELYRDANGNGILDSSDALLQTVSTATQNSQAGQYVFANLGPGPYVLHQVHQTGHVLTFPAPPGTRSFRASSGVSLTAQDFGDINNPTHSFLYQAYLDLLHRVIDPVGLAGWTSFVNQGGTRLQVVQAIETSNEYRTNEVQMLYQTYLHRPVDATGLAGALALLGNVSNTPGAGDPLVQIEVNILASAEYFQSRGGNTNAGYITVLFQDVLARTPDAATIAAYSNLLAHGTPRAAVARGILTSTEAEQDLVQADFLQFLHRPADSATLSAFASALQHDVRIDDLVATLVGSDEYFARL